MIQQIIKNLLKNDTILLEQNIIKQIDGKFILNSRYKIGKIVVKKHIAYFVVDDTQSFKISLDELGNAYDQDIVLAQMVFHPRAKKKIKIVKIIEKHNQDILCYIKENKLYGIKYDVSIETNLDLKQYQNGDVVIVGNEMIKEHLGNIKNANVDEKISLYLYEQSYRLKKYDTHINSQIRTTNRVDLTHLPFCTIDPATAKDHDDAIYFDKQNSILYVAIADVSSFVKEDTALDEEAKKRAFSIYLPNKVLPMLPFSLSADLCSLKPNVKRLAFVVKMFLDTKKLVVKKSEFIEATIVSKNKYSYEQIDDVLEEENQQYDDILQLYTLTAKLRKKRLQNGFDFKTSELRLILDEDENLDTVVVEHSTKSHQLVEECMLLANCEAAKQLKEIGIFRVHDEPNLKDIEKLIDDVSMLGLKVKLKNNIYQTIQSIQDKAKNVNLTSEVDRLIIQSQQQARYSSKALGHFGLGFKYYSHFTSPIRRYSDLVLHRILKTKNIPHNIDDICVSISDKERSINSLVWDIEDRKYARWAENNINLEYEAKIIDIEKKIAVLTSGMLGAKVMCENYAGEKLFSTITIKIIKSDLIHKKISANIIK